MSSVTVPTLREAYRTFPDVRFNLDMKARGIERLLANTIRDCGREDTTLVGSFSDRRLRHFRL